MAEKQEGIVAEYAWFWMRLGAYIIDGIALWIIGTILGAIFGLFTLPFAIREGPIFPHNMPYSYFTAFYPG